MKHLIFIVILLGYVAFASADAGLFGVVHTPAPVLNSPDFNAVFGGTGGDSLKTDRCGQVRELEFIALPGSKFTILKKLRSGTADIYQVETDEYRAPPNVNLYVDGRFLVLERTAAASRKRLLPPRDDIVSALRGAAGSSYVWGGNVLNGVPGLSALKNVDNRESNRGLFALAGLDCSGLLYHATGGWTPRNTSQLISFGQGMEIAGKRNSEIMDMLQPLDLIAWNGHVIIVLDRETVIESRLECGKPGNGGVTMTPLSRRLADVMRVRRPANVWPAGNKRQNFFVVRRWYDPK